MRHLLAPINLNLHLHQSILKRSIQDRWTVIGLVKAQNADAVGTSLDEKSLLKLRPHQLTHLG
jgi:hypothetical protein